MKKKLNQKEWYKKNQKEIDNEFLNTYSDLYNDYIIATYEEYLEEGE